MSTLKKIHYDFKKGLFNKEPSAFIENIKINSIDPNTRFTIYKNTILENLRCALELTFPAIWQLLGKQCADNVAYTFIQDEANLPITGCLDDWGETFPQFLGNFQPLSHLVYLQDIATIEWLKHLSYCASDSASVEIALLQNYTESDLLNLQFVFHESVFLYQADYPLNFIYELIDNPDIKTATELKKMPSYLIVMRSNNEVVTEWLNASIFNFFICLRNGFTLEKAFEYVNKTDVSFNLSDALQFMFSKKMIIATSLNTRPT